MSEQRTPKANRRAARNERLRTALRDNLKRRKAQLRGRDRQDRGGEERPEDSPGRGGQSNTEEK